MWSLGDFVLYGGLVGVGLLCLCVFGYYAFERRKKNEGRNQLLHAFIGTNENIV